jgi:hypothetical protein
MNKRKLLRRGPARRLKRMGNKEYKFIPRNLFGKHKEK